MNPQIFGVLMDRLLAQGALDVFYTSIQMKKGRPGTLVTIIAPPERRDAITALIFRETTTIGVRYREMSRECLDRETILVETPLGSVRFKVARRNGKVLSSTTASGSPPSTTCPPSTCRRWPRRRISTQRIGGYYRVLHHHADLLHQRTAARGPCLHHDAGGCRRTRTAPNGRGCVLPDGD